MTTIDKESEAEFNEWIDNGNPAGEYNEMYGDIMENSNTPYLIKSGAIEDAAYELLQEIENEELKNFTRRNWLSFDFAGLFEY